MPRVSANKKSTKVRTGGKQKDDDYHPSTHRKTKNDSIVLVDNRDRNTVMGCFMSSVSYFLLPVLECFKPQVGAYVTPDAARVISDEVLSRPRVLGAACGAHFLPKLFHATAFLVRLNLPRDWTVSSAQVKGYFLGKPRQVFNQRGHVHQLIPGSGPLELPKFVQACNYLMSSGMASSLLVTSIDHDGYKETNSKMLPPMSQHSGWWALEFQVQVNGEWQTVAWHLILCTTIMSLENQVAAIESRLPGFKEELKQMRILH
jgi:hypothetical protein